MIRHSALFVWAAQTSEEQKVRVKDGVAYCYYGSGVLSLDFGEGLGLAPTRHGFALQHDHADRAAWDAYNDNAAHRRVGAMLKAITKPELAARVDWVCAAPPAVRGGARHVAMYRWSGGAVADARSAAQAAIASLRDRCPSVLALEIGDDLGWYSTNYDWVVEAHFANLQGLAAFVAHPARAEADAVVARATASDATATVQALMLAG